MLGMDCVAIKAALSNVGTRLEAVEQIEGTIIPNLMLLETQGIECTDLILQANTQLGSAYFEQGNFDKAFQFFSTGYVSSITALSALGSSQCSDLDTLVMLLTDYTNSPLRDAFDLDDFIPLRDIGIHIQKCMYGKALLGATLIHPGLEIPLRRKLVTCMIRYFERLRIEDLALEFNTCKQSIVELIIDLPEYRLDFLNQEIVRITHNEKLTTIQKQTEECVRNTWDQLKLTQLRIMLDKTCMHNSE